MNQHLMRITLVITLATQALFCSAESAPAPLLPLPQHAQAAHLSAELLEHFHYTGQPLDAAMSGKIFDRYLKTLDPERLFLLQGDVDEMSKDREKLGAAIMSNDLTIPFAMFNVYAQRASERVATVRALIKPGFDFTVRESYQINREKAPWPKTDAEANELWRKRVKNEWLRLKLAGEPAARIAVKLDKRYENDLREVGRIKSNDAFETFMNAYTMAIDPHTNYMAPGTAQDFDISMRLSLVGIGATMAEKDGFNTVIELIAGGPAAASGKVNVGDRIVGVGQGKGAPMTNTQGLRLDETVTLVRGAAGSTVVLDILPAGTATDGAHKTISLVRKKVDLEDEAAKKTLLTVQDAGVTRRIGVITLPTFYRDFEGEQRKDPHFRSASGDVARLLAEFKTDKADGVLIDLRNNGGGSLAEAVALTALFTGKGPVLQQRDAKGNVVVDSDTSTNVAWSGPVAVLINRNSASASEVFAAAIQDYGRGVVIGERSFGKGTVQTTISLDELVKQPVPQFGELKMTIAQFFRINGGTTQLRGVTPDIDFFSASNDADWGEDKFDNAVPWMRVTPASYVANGALKAVIPTLAKRSQRRVQSDTELNLIKAEQDQATFQRKKNLVSLNEADRRQERTLLSAALEPKAGGKPGLPTTPGGAAKAHAEPDDGLEPGERDLASELAARSKHKTEKDVLLNEAAHVVSDEVDLMQSGSVGTVEQAAPAARSRKRL
ncbi:carboxyl-terminal processing protease [Actimicrobium sp. GrIS 1.19]|uniref:carboxy terminal-processing peptidase n=1 Tax=Actimicrobium sp. GrIS 1.19 TaxID=3071708 RepID=UPI002E04A32C|nr:carboxyl-terminal processing protease [Actimicrobium sp. GrIS 1.19]